MNWLVGAALLVAGIAKAPPLPTNTWVGKAAPEFELADRTGKIWKLSDFRGNAIFLNFWASWCQPCRAEFPQMEILNQKLKAKNFSMIAVSVDNSWAEVDAFLRLVPKPPSFLILLDPSKNVVSKIYHTVQFPETFVLDSHLIIRAKYEGALPWIQPDVWEQLENFLWNSKTPLLKKP